MTRPVRAHINLQALQHNFSRVQQAAPRSRVMAIIKANAYGHGMVTVAQHLQDVDAFAVARVPEAVQLRQDGVDAPIVLLAGVMNSVEMKAAVEWGFEPVVHCHEQLELLEAVAAASVNVWLKFDTGMNRL